MHYLRTSARGIITTDWLCIATCLPVIFLHHQLGTTSSPHCSWLPAGIPYRIYAHSLFALAIWLQVYIIHTRAGAPVGGQSLLLSQAFHLYLPTGAPNTNFLVLSLFNWHLQIKDCKAINFYSRMWSCMHHTQVWHSLKGYCTEKLRTTNMLDFKCF